MKWEPLPPHSLSIIYLDLIVNYIYILVFFQEGSSKLSPGIHNSLLYLYTLDLQLFNLSGEKQQLMK